MEERYDWSGTLSAPLEYPAEVYKGELIANGYTQGFKNWGVIASGWGNPNGTVITGPDTKPVPDSLSLTWLSFAENKFYSGRFALPKEKIAKLFKDGFMDDRNQHVTYTQIVVGLAPEGTIAVWLMAPQKEIEVATFKAHPSSIDPETISDDDKYMFRQGYAQRTMDNEMVITPEVKNSISANGSTPAESFEETYRNRYNWKPVLNAEGIVKNFVINSYNGEREKLTDLQATKTEYAKRAVPAMVVVYWTAPDGKEHGAKILLNEKEIINAYKSAATGDLDFVIHQQDSAATVSIKSGNKETEIKNADIKAF